MRIYKLLFALLVVWALPAYGQGTISDFLSSRGVGGAQLDSFAEGSQCLKTSDYMLCGESHNYPGISGNALAAEAIAKNLGLSARYKLYEFVRENEKSPVKESLSASTAFKSSAEHDGRVFLKGVEFAIFADGNWRCAVAAIPIKQAPESAQSIYDSANFKAAYGKSMFNAAREQYASQKYAETLATLAEIQRFCGANADVLLLAANAFLKNGQPEETERIAREIWKNWQPQLNAAQMESLGDIFMETGDQTAALAAYNGALSLSESRSMH